MKILLLDIETAPNLAYVWGLFKETVGTNQIVNSGYVMCWAAKWLDKKEIMFDSIMRSSHKTVIRNIHRLLDEADTVVHYNGLSFDIPTLNKEFLLAGLKPPAPYKQIDLLRVVRDKFRFPSNKLDYVAQTVKIGEKIRTEGFELWVQCMTLDKKAWRKMERYNKHDVVLLERAYKKLLPWIDKHPNRSIAAGIECCPNCGSTRAQQRGMARQATAVYRRFQCQECGKWYRGGKVLSRASVGNVALS